MCQQPSSVCTVDEAAARRQELLQRRTSDSAICLPLQRTTVQAAVSRCFELASQEDSRKCPHPHQAYELIWFGRSLNLYSDRTWWKLTNETDENVIQNLLNTPVYRGMRTSPQRLGDFCSIDGIIPGYTSDVQKPMRKWTHKARIRL